MKPCKKCGEDKPLEQFHKCPTTRDKRRNECKACHHKRNREWIKNNPEKAAAHFRKSALKRYQRLDVRLEAKSYRQSEKGVETQRRNALRRHYAHPEKSKAHAKVTSEIRAGRLSRLPCEVCGSSYRVEGHHDDYSKPLAVRWLCKKHHMEHHRLEREAQRQQQQ